MPLSDREIILSIRSGNSRAWDELIARYSGRIYSFALRLSRSPEIAEDAAQETFVKVWKNLKKFDESKSFQSWIFAIARNATLDILRKRKDVLLDEDTEDVLPDETIDLASDAFDREVAKDILEEAVAHLTINQRSVVYLHDMEGKTFDEISQITGKPLNTEKSHYRRAIQSLRRILEDRGMHQNLL